MNQPTQHTPTPWAVHSVRAVIVPESHLNRPLGAHEDAKIDLATYAQEICAMHWPDRNRSESEVKANAQRIVACVNACAGISNEQLESWYITNGNILDVIKMQTKYANEIEQQNAELLEALKAARLYVSSESYMYQKLTAAIAKATS